MKNDCLSEIRLDENGNPDAIYYINMAHELRAQALHGWFSAFVGWCAKALRKSLTRFHAHRPSLGH